MKNNFKARSKKDEEIKLMERSVILFGYVKNE